MATIEEKELRFGGLEDKISGFSYFVLVFGILGLFLDLWLANDSVMTYKVSGTPSQMQWGHVWLVVGFTSFIGGATIFMILQGIAEIIRILREQNNLLHSGKISSPSR